MGWTKVKIPIHFCHSLVIFVPISGPTPQGQGRKMTYATDMVVSVRRYAIDCRVTRPYQLHDQGMVIISRKEVISELISLNLQILEKN